MTISDESTLRKSKQQYNAIKIVGACDATWVFNLKHRRSIRGIIMMLAKTAVYYRTRLQPTIAQSLTEVEFINIANDGKATLHRIDLERTWH